MILSTWCLVQGVGIHNYVVRVLALDGGEDLRPKGETNVDDEGKKKTGDYTTTYDNQGTLI